MSPALHNYLFIQLIVLANGLSQLVKTQKDVTATLGEDAVLTCELMTPKDVRQVTWQKETPGPKENVATYSKRGPDVNVRFKGKVEFEDEGLQNCSIVIRGVSRGDESCYKCLFNTFPEGAISGTTCLKVNELYGPSLLITQTNNSHTTLSCSATGRPVPIVTWDDIMIEHSNMVDVTHPNGTVTMTTTVTVVVSSLTDKEVRCVASMSFSDVTKNVSMVIPASITGQSQVSDDDRISGTVVGAVMGAVLCLMCLIAVFCVIWWQKRRKDTSSRKPPVPDPEISRTPLKTPPTSKQSQSLTSSPNSSTTSSPNNSTTSSPNNSTTSSPNSSTTSSPNSSTTKRRMTKNSSPSQISSDKRRMQQAQEAVKKNLFNDY